MISTLAIENYRSIRRLVMPLKGVNVVTGANGTGKSSLYRALRLLADSSHNGAVAALAREGGLGPTLWAGPEAGSSGAHRRGHPTQGTHTRAAPIGLKLGFGGEEFGYAVDFGLPAVGGATAFLLDPEIKAESIWHGPQLRSSSVLTERVGSIVKVRDAQGSWTIIDHRLRPYDSMLSELGVPEQAPEVLAIREQLRSWRFYDHFRTDSTAPARASHAGTRTPILSADGADLAAALQTIIENGSNARLAEVIDRAFPGSRLEIVYPGSAGGDRDPAGRFEVALHQPGLLRPLSGVELSDGTLRYLLLVAALLSPRPPALFVLNEPETSLHPDLFAPLAALIQVAAQNAQIIVVTHAESLVEGLSLGDGLEVSAQILELVKEDGETKILGQGRLDEPPWSWPAR
jgi:predicted ATPase